MSNTSIVAGGEKYLTTNEVVTNNGFIRSEFNCAIESDNIFPQSAFVGCDLEEVRLPETVNIIKKYAFFWCHNLKMIFIPNGVEEIERLAFEFCKNLSEVYIPSSITQLSPAAFSGSRIFSKIVVAKEDPLNCSIWDKDVFFNATLIVPKGSKSKYQENTYWKHFENIKEEEFVHVEADDITLIVGEALPSFTYTVEGGELNGEPKFYCDADGKTVGQYEIKLLQGSVTNDYVIFRNAVLNVVPKNYKLTYIVDDEEYKTYEIEFGATITPEAEPTKEGYSFSGWSEIPETMPAHDVTVTGAFTINKYKLTYAVDGVEYKSYELEYGASITPETLPVKEGYTFSGWSEIPETMPAHNVTVTGTFTINKYKLIYAVDGEEYKSYELKYGASITPETVLAKEGYTFSGWSEIPETMPAHDVTVTGAFTINKYKLTYAVDGEEYKSYELEYGASITPETVPTKEGYTFSGWSEIPETMPADDVTITGSFTINMYKLIYMVDGEVYKSYELEYGASITPEADLTKEGYTFSGWSEIPETMPANDMIVTGDFSINKYTITYIIDNEVFLTVESEYGAKISVPEAPNRDGFDFAWENVPETMPANNITIWGTYITSINSIYINPFSVNIYDIRGNRIENIRKGVNIIRMNNGKTKKIVVK